MGLSINGVTNLGGRGLSAKRRHYSICLFREMGDMEREGKKYQKMGDAIDGRPLY